MNSFPLLIKAPILRCKGSTLAHSGPQGLVETQSQLKPHPVRMSTPLATVIGSMGLGM